MLQSLRNKFVDPIKGRLWLSDVMVTWVFLGLALVFNIWAVVGAIILYPFVLTIWGIWQEKKVYHYEE